MGSISGLKSKMSAGKINPGVYQMTETVWVEKESKKGDDQIFFGQQLVDLDGHPHKLELFAMATTAYGGSDRVVEINKKGQLVTVGDATVKFNRNIGAGKYLDSLNDCGFSPKKLDNIDLEPGGLDGQWVRIDTPPSGKTDDKGNPYTDVIVAELLDKPPSKGSKGSANTGTVKKTSAPVEEPDDDDNNATTEPDEEADELDASDDEIEAAIAYVQEMIADPNTFIKNFDEDAAAGGVTLKQANTSVFAKFKGKGALKGKIASLVGNPKFHEQHADGWTFDEDEGVILPPKKKKSK